MIVILYRENDTFKSSMHRQGGSNLVDAYCCRLHLVLHLSPDVLTGQGLKSGLGLNVAFLKSRESSVKLDVIV